MAATHAAVVLAAGASRRLGRPKQLLTREGETLLRRAARLALASGAARTVVVLGANRERLQNELTGLAVQSVFNPHWEQGLSSSLRAAADALDVDPPFTGPILVLGCDQPALEAHHLCALVSGAAAAAAGCAAAVHRQALGVPALIAPELWREATALRGDRGFGAALVRQPVGTVWRLDAPDLELDLDTPADLDEAVARGWIDPLADRYAT
ncbi:nucleotidyltransferase family protein [Lysobacter sp. CA199]|uniref:nucleotidyltransferase family protein n=1 Tax=Lysobacter sp. CA199 TaxID=3455608 RepID=UPI003F8D0915